MIKFLGRRIQLTKTLLVLSYRDDEVSSKHPLHFLLGDFPSHLSTRIPVPRLSENAVQLLARRAGRQSQDLYRVTGGNPFFVSEVIAAGAEGVPASVRDAVLARVARLAPPAKKVVELAALMPGAAEIWLIEAILHPAASALDECVERGILRSKGDFLTFRHELARQAVEGSLPVGKSHDTAHKDPVNPITAHGGRSRSHWRGLSTIQPAQEIKKLHCAMLPRPPGRRAL